MGDRRGNERESSFRFQLLISRSSFIPRGISKVFPPPTYDIDKDYHPRGVLAELRWMAIGETPSFPQIPRQVSFLIPLKY